MKCSENTTESIKNKIIKTKGLSVAIDNEVLEGYTKDKGFKMKHLSSLFTLLIWNKLNALNGYLDFETVSGLLGLKMENTHDRMFKYQVRKALKELYPTIEYKEDIEKGIKFTHIPKENYTEKRQTKGFTQLYCGLATLENRDLIVLHTVLEYFKGASKEVNPSLDTLASLSGCSRRNIVTLLKEGQKLGLWKIESTKGGSTRHTNKYHLSYTTEEGKERYYYLDVIEQQQEYLDGEKVI